MDLAIEENRDDDVIQFLTKIKRAAVLVLTEGLSFNVPPREIFRHVAAFVRDGLEEFAMLKLALTRDAIHALLQHDEIRTNIRARVLNVIADE